MKVEYVTKGQYKADFRDAMGRRVRITIAADTKKLAISQAKLLAKGEVANDYNARGITVYNAMRRADKEHYSNGKTKRSTAVNMRQLECQFGKDTLLKDITRETVMDAIEDWKGDDKSPATINRRLSLLSKVFRLSMDWSDSGVKVPPKMPKLKESKGKTRVITMEEELEISTLLASDSLHHDLFNVLIDTGMRLGEALGLQHAPLDYDIIESRALAEYYAYSEINLKQKKIHIWVNKGDRPRTIPMTDRVFAILKRREDQLVFDGLNQYNVAKKWKWLRKQMHLTGDKGFSAHTCRHTCATRLWDLTRDIYLVKEWLGHASVETTQRYTHLASDSLDGAAALLNGVSKELSEMDTTVTQ
jgi:integrase